LTGSLNLPNDQGLICDGGVRLLYDDTESEGAYLLSNGVDDTRGGGLYVENLCIILCSVTAKGVDLLNSVGSHFAGRLYVEGKVPSTEMSSRSNIGLQIRSSEGTDSFWNVFDWVWMNHCHTGIFMPAGGIATQQLFRYVTLYGDSIYGDTSANGIVISGCNYSVIEAGYMEAYAGGTSAAINVFGSSTQAVGGWRISNVIFDHANESGVGPIAMNAIRLTNSGDGPYPNGMSFLGCTFSSACSVVDDTGADRGNFVENNPTTPGAVWTAMMRPMASGTITLQSGAGGDRCFAERRGRTIKVWGQLVVDSVASPVGRLFIDGLPSVAMDDDSNIAAVGVWATGLSYAGATSVQGYIHRNTSSIEVSLFAAGSASIWTANVVQAGTVVVFKGEYIGSDIA
jgi:hypothetical protein